MPQQRNVGLSVSNVGGPERQVAHLRVLMAAMGLEMEWGYLSRDASVNAKNTACTIGPVGEPLESVLGRGQLSCRE